MLSYNEGIYRIVRTVGGWCVARLAGRYDNGQPRWRSVSNTYRFRGWAQAYARRMKITVQNY